MLDPIATFWVILWITLGSYGIYLLFTNDKGLAARVYVYGKSLDDLQKQPQHKNNRIATSNIKIKKGLFWQLFLIPKKCFTHFYVTALFLAFLPSLIVVLVYYIPKTRSNSILVEHIEVLRNLLEIYRVQFQVHSSLSSITALVFTLILMIIQASRRLYECLCISVYSSQSKINVLHYFFGHLFYIIAALSTVAPILLSQTHSKYSLSSLLDDLITKQRALGFILFIYCSHHQQKCNKLLANLRKDKAGQVITEQHYVPAGGLFDFVSCPHFLIEVILYFLIIFVQDFQFLYWNLIFLLVVTTQTINAVIEHNWYKRKYKDFPKERKAIYPKLL